MPVTFVLCSDPLRPRRADPHFAREERAARDAGLPVVLIDHDALLSGDARAAVSAVPGTVDAGPCWYRGWMIPADRYTDLAAALAGRGGHRLVTDPGAYRTGHELPGWYGAFAAATPRSAWLPARPGRAPGPDRLARLAAELGGGPGLVKDYVKSRKHEWEDACFVPDLADTARLAAVVGRFVELQEDVLSGGVVLRAFENLSGSAEARVWWVGGEPVLVTAHPDTPDEIPRPSLDAFRAPVAALGCPFVTTDLALRDDGVRRVVEVGDGQVSDLPPGADARVLVAAPAGLPALA